LLNNQQNNKNIKFTSSHKNNPQVHGTSKSRNFEHPEILVFTNKCNVYKIENKYFYSKQHIL